MALPPTFEARLLEGRMISPSVRELTFERVDGAPVEFAAGQWVSLVLPLADGEVRRAYSIASPPNGTPRFQIAVTHVAGGPGSTYLHALEPGAALKAVGPQGFFTRTAPNAPALFIATGTGVTPLRSMLHDAVKSGEQKPLWLLFGVRHEADRLYMDELGQLAQKHPNVRVEYSLSQPQPDWTGRRGYVQTHVKELWEALVARGEGAPHAYICGLQRMVAAVREVLKKELDVPRQQVHSERYD
jgi:ferredoxin-NADP reductase